MITGKQRAYLRSLAQNDNSYISNRKKWHRGSFFSSNRAGS